jgi:alpha-ribazole phosphatase
VLLVCHGGVIRMVLSHVLGLSPGKAMAGFQVPFACRSQVRIDDTEHGTLRCLVRHG